MNDDRRVIEDYLPIEPISEAATSEPRTKGHISTLHIWRARRPLAACRAAVYGVLVPADKFSDPGDADNDEARRGRVEEFMARLCTYDAPSTAIREAQRHIWEAHAARLTEETGQPVSADDIAAGRAPRPKVLDMFAGGGAIPLEAARLGCESHAVELNPVAHIIELCTIDYPQRYGPELADEIERWAEIALRRTWDQVKDLYAEIAVAGDEASGHVQAALFDDGAKQKQQSLSIVAHYWTRTVPCPNAGCRATVPLYRQTWLRNKPSGYVALRVVPDRAKKRVRFEVAEAKEAADLGFDPSEGMKGTNTECPFCRTPVPGPYIRNHGNTLGCGQQLMCVIALNPWGSGKLYIADESLIDGEVERQERAEERANALEAELGMSSLDEEIPPTGNVGLMSGKSYLYGIRTFRQMFLPRQRCVLLALAREIRRCHQEMLDQELDSDHAKAVATYLGLWLSKLTDRFNGLARWDSSRENAQSLTSLKRFAMMWDYPEINIFGGASGDAMGGMEYITSAIRREGQSPTPTTCVRASARELPFRDGEFDAVITDPPYYDNESYAELSDVCYVWLRFAIGALHPEHFAGRLTPKKQEVVAAAYRQGGTQEAAYAYFEQALFESLREAHRVLKAGAPLVMVYAHKTTRGWASLVEALRRAEFEVTEAWPVETETTARVAHRGDAVLASSIFFAARKRQADGIGSYEDLVRPEMERVVRERVEDLWLMGIVGADLLMAAVGAGLRAYTRFGEVHYANGKPVPADQYLMEVQGLVSELLLEHVFGVGAEGVQAIDPWSRTYVLWRYTYGAAPVPAGEAIVFAQTQQIELDGPTGLSGRAVPMVRRTRRSDEVVYEALDYRARGEDAELGLPTGSGQPVPQIDVLHRILWLNENRTRQALEEFLDEARPETERLRLVAEALAGVRLEGSQAKGQLVATTPEEQQALNTLLASWRAVVEAGALAPRRGEQQALPGTDER